MRFLCRYGQAFILLAVMSTVGCKVADDAIAASQQMTSTASGLRDYYRTLDAEVADTNSLYELEQATAGIPYGDDDRKPLLATRQELQKRADVAEALAQLSSAMALLVSSRSSADAEASATQLGNELNSLGALPGGASVPTGLGKAGNVIVELIRQHDEKKAARAMSQTLHDVEGLFAAEKPIYDSIARTHGVEASQVTQDLIKANAVDPSPMLAPALRPYGLIALPPSAALQNTLKTLALSRLQASAIAATRSEEQASAAMLEALHEMNLRVDLLASEKPMPLRGAPWSLKNVEDWVQSWSASLI